MHKVVSDLLRQRALLVSLAIDGLYDYLASAPQAPREQIPVRVVVFDNQSSPGRCLRQPILLPSLASPQVVS